MKKLIMLIMLLVFVALPVSAMAGDCEQYRDMLVGQCFETTIDNVDYTLCFGDSVFGPCPSGIAVLSYINVQVIDGTEYAATFNLDCSYYTTYTEVVVEGIEFVLAGDRLIMLPDEPLILNKVMEE